MSPIRLHCQEQMGIFFDPVNFWLRCRKATSHRHEIFPAPVIPLGSRRMVFPLASDELLVAFDDGVAPAWKRCGWRRTLFGRRGSVNEEGFSFGRLSFARAWGDTSGFDDVGELEYRAGDGQHDVDLLLLRPRIALEINAAVDRLVGWDGDCLQMRSRCRELDCFLDGSLSGCLEFAGFWSWIQIRRRYASGGV
jgi:hypothetical protein